MNNAVSPPSACIAEPDLSNAINQGIQRIEKDLFRFWDPGLSLSALLGAPQVRHNGLIEYYRFNLQKHASWTMVERQPQERFLRWLLAGSRSCTEPQQRKLLNGKTQAGIAVVTTFLILDALLHGENPISYDTFARCPECLNEDSCHTTAGRAGNGKIRLDFAWSDIHYQDVGIAVLETSA